MCLLPRKILKGMGVLCKMFGVGTIGWYWIGWEAKVMLACHIVDFQACLGI
jgi:hypothetical protein